MLFVIVLVHLPFSSQAGLSDQYKKIILKDLKNYLTQIKSVAIDFEQIDSNGSYAKGVFIVSKPYKFRCNYYPPFPILIVGNKQYISIYDYQMEHLTRINVKDNVFNFLLIENEDFESKFDVSSIKTIEKYHQIELINKLSNQHLLIFFDRTHKQIKKVVLPEEDNQITINLTKVTEISKPRNDLFIIRNPDVFGPIKHFDESDIKKYLKLN